MTLANVLGLLGLLGIVALIIIYIIKPNFQQKFISSTHVWNLSLKYRRRRIPINKLRNLLLVLCQVLILTLCALILAKPVVAAEKAMEYNEKIVIIDASANMKAVNNGVTRFERAVSMVQDLAAEVLSEEDGKISIIFADDEANMYSMEVINEFDMLPYNKDVSRLDATFSDELQLELDSLLTDLSYGRVDDYCTFGSADIDGAMKLAETLLDIYPDSEVLYYTGTEYIDSGIVEVVDVKEEGEHNAAILTGTASINEMYTYTFAVDVAVYGVDTEASVSFTVYGANSSSSNPSGTDIVYEPVNVTCIANEVQTVELNTWIAAGMDDPNADEDAIDGVVYNFDYVHVQISVNSSQCNDVLSYDDSFYFYGGNTETLKVQYATTEANIFVNSILSAWRSELAYKWNISITEVPVGVEPETSGFDIYIFEHETPDVIPDDGVVILLDPHSFSVLNKDGLAMNGNIQVDWASRLPFDVEDPTHPIVKSLGGELIEITKGNTFEVTNDDLWDTLMTVSFEDNNGNPVTGTTCAVKNEKDSKVLVFSLNANHTDFVLKTAFPVMMTDIFNYFFPAVTNDYLYEIGETASFTAISDELEYRTPNSQTEDVFDSYPASLYLNEVGTYSVSQSLLSGRKMTTEFYVKMPAAESDILRVVEELDNPYVEKVPEPEDLDLLVWFAAALVALLFAEWWLQSREQF